MAAKSEFEEKEYENPLNVELLFQSTFNLWTPGQVFEKDFGIDAALYAANPQFWWQLGYKNIPEGIIIDNFQWGHIWRKTGKKRTLPDFSTNLFIQAKRPEYRKGNNPSYTKYGIKGEYWMFYITKHQQKALEKIARKINKRALVIYACPVFHTLSDLYKNIRKNALIEQSTFVKAENLKNHTKWVYNEPGTKGIACSEINEFDEGPLSDLIENFREKNYNQEQSGDSLKDLAIEIINSFNELEDDNPIKSEFFYRQNLIQNIDINLEFNQPLKNYLTVNLMCRLLNLNWQIIG